MGTIADIEIRPIDCDLTPKERAAARDSFVRSFERQFSDWTAIAQACLEVDRDKDYLLLGFHSWNAWLLDAAPMSRSYIYIAVGRYKELIPDIPVEELSRIPLASAKELMKVSSTVRQNPKVKSVAIKVKKARELRQFIQDNHPEQHLDSVVERKLKFTSSQWDRIETAYETYLLASPGASLESFIDWMVVEFQ